MRELRESSETLEIPKEKPPSALPGFGALEQFQPYKEGEPLPPAEIVINRKGARVLKKPGEPRFYFNGNEMIKVYIGLGGKKRSLFWFCNPKKSQSKKIREYLRSRGIPGA